MATGEGRVDGDGVRRCAGDVAGLADEVRRLAAGVAAARALRWRSPAAEGFRSALAEQQSRLTALAARLDDAAAVLAAHARAVDEAGPLGALAGGLEHAVASAAGQGR